MKKKQAVVISSLSILALALLLTVSNSWAHIGGPRVLKGRMTGGGSIFTDENDLFAPPGTRLTHGFELHCDPLETPNNLEVEVHLPNGDGGRFHLDSLDFSWCWQDPDIDSKPPSAPFNTLFGSGTGRYNGQSGFCADWEFSDAGEPGTNDRVRSMRIWQPRTGGDCSIEEQFLFSIYLEPGHTLTFGNHQALKDNK